MFKLASILIICFLIISCKDRSTNGSEELPAVPGFISAVDISRFPDIQTSGAAFTDRNGNPGNVLEMLKDHGVNTIRLKLWVTPETEASSFEEVKDFSEELKALGFNIWLTVHYSDTWADPGKQLLPSRWEGIGFESLKDSVYAYTSKVITQLDPDYIQIGNEVNAGFLHPFGDISKNSEQFIELLETGISAVRDHSSKTHIMIHYAGIEHSGWFFDQVQSLDYDIIGISYYPIWHGKSLTNLESTMRNLSTQFDKDIVIAETAYPFTLNWNDNTHNIVGLDEQLILPDYPASPDGQQRFIRDIGSLINSLDRGIGMCYWGAELIAWKGTQATDGSPWENQALFDFSNRALPVLNQFHFE
ncbi:MAG: glycosyl hydrolase 53 family protein [Bacteroidota bacterium]